MCFLVQLVKETLLRQKTGVQAPHGSSLNCTAPPHKKEAKMDPHLQNIRDGQAERKRQRSKGGTKGSGCGLKPIGGRVPTGSGWILKRSLPNKSNRS